MNGWIEIVSGTLGGGKSMFAVQRIYEHLKSGGWVFTNIEIYYDMVKAQMLEDGLIFQPERLVKLVGNEETFHTQVSRGTADSAVMVVIDEAGLSHNAVDHAKLDRGLLTFNTLARKLDIILIYISQDPTDVVKQFRKKARFIWICRNLSHFRLLGVIPMGVPMMFRVCFDNTRGGGKPMHVRTDIGFRRPWLCKLYNSDALLGKGSDEIAKIATVRGTPLERVKRHDSPATKTRPLFSPSLVLCAAFSASCYLLS